MTDFERVLAEVRRTGLYRLSIWGARTWLLLPFVACFTHGVWPILTIFLVGAIAGVPFGIVASLTVAVPSFHLGYQHLADVFNPRFY
jgi:hypothetical protein